ESVRPAALAGQAANLLARRQLRQAHARLPVAPGEDLAVRRKGQAPRLIATGGDRAEHFPFFYIPGTHRVVQVSGGQRLAVGTEGQARDVAGLAAEVVDLAARGQVPQAQPLVAAGRHQGSAVGGENQRANTLLVGRELADFLARRQVPDADDAAGIAAAGDERLAVGGEGQRAEVGKAVEDLAGTCLGDVDGALPTGDGHQRPVGRKYHIRNPLLRTRVLHQRLAGGGVP